MIKVYLKWYFSCTARYNIKQFRYNRVYISYTFSPTSPYGSMPSSTTRLYAL